MEPHATPPERPVRQTRSTEHAGRTAAVCTLGCRLNQAESASICDQLHQSGFRIVPWGHAADLLVVNSCTVTAAGAQKTRKAVRSARRRHPDALIVLAGCSADIEGSRWLREGGADLIVPNAGKPRIGQVLPRDLRRPRRPKLIRLDATPEATPFRQDGTGYYPDRTRANLKIQEGCDYFCSYCVVPYARGRPRSREWDDALREARGLLERGHREIVLSGVNIATYNHGGRGLAELVAEMASLEGSFRIRLSSVEPGPELGRLLQVMADTPQVCRFLHLPLQYGEDGMLRAMNRRYTVADYAESAELALALVPGICLGSDVIVGFPGETERQFETCRLTIDRLPLAYLHVFRYSAREPTAAARLSGRVDGRVAAARRQQLGELGLRKSQAFAEAHIGRELDVLVEKETREGTFEGLSDNYLRVSLHGNGLPLSPGAFVRTGITRAFRDMTVEGRAKDAW